MEALGFAITGAMRVALHVVSQHRRPLLEVYHEVRNILSPPQEFRIPTGASGSETEMTTHQFQDVFVQFVIVNVGGVRAEDVVLGYSGSLDRNMPSRSIRETEIFSTAIPQLAPGQILFLFRLDEHDLYRYPHEGEKAVLTDETFTITASYNGPNRGLNRVTRMWQTFRSGKQYRDSYTFNPKIVWTDLPAPEYAAR